MPLAHSLPTSAQSLDVDASAKLVKPIEIEAGSALDFGVVAIPPAGNCAYEIGPDGTLNTSSASGCQFVSGEAYPAEFTVSCGDNQSSVRFEAVYTDVSPSGVEFLPPKNPVQIDGEAPGNLVQSVSCDADGISIVRAGGVLSVASDADPFEGRVGSIRLEASFE